MKRREENQAKAAHFNETVELIGGRQAVRAALQAGRAEQVLISAGQRGGIIDEIAALAHRNKVTVEVVPRDRFNTMVEAIPSAQGVAALVPSFTYITLPELISLARSSKSEPFLIMLDHVEDPHNLGAVMRTADAGGAGGLIIPDRRAASVTSAVRKVAAGAAERVPVALVGNLSRAAEELKKAGFWLYGSEADGEKEYYRADFRRPLVLVIGSEGKGLSPLLRSKCDLILKIPMPECQAGSLNLSAAAAVLIYAALAQREGWSS